MLTKMLIGVCAAVLSGACGVDAVDEPATSTATQAVLWECNQIDSWTRYWYVSGAEVGREECACDGTLVKLGQRAGTYVQVEGSACTGGGGGGGTCIQGGPPTSGRSTNSAPPPPSC